MDNTQNDVMWPSTDIRIQSWDTTANAKNADYVNVAALNCQVQRQNKKTESHHIAPYYPNYLI